jgi:hypothetical protein
MALPALQYFFASLSFVLLLSSLALLFVRAPVGIGIGIGVGVGVVATVVLPLAWFCVLASLHSLLC